MHTRTTLLGAVMVAAMAVAAAGCGSGTNKSTTASSTVAPSTTVPAMSPSTTSREQGTTTIASPTATTTTPVCFTANLSFTSLGGQGLGGTSYTYYEFTNRGPETCSMYGYPGVAVLNAQGQVVQHPATRSSHPGTSAQVPVQTVTLPPGDHAKFLLTSTDTVPNPDCQTYFTGTTFQVYPPGNTVPIRQPYHGSFCDLVVGPVQPA